MDDTSGSARAQQLLNAIREAVNVQWVDQAQLAHLLNDALTPHDHQLLAELAEQGVIEIYDEQPNPRSPAYRIKRNAPDTGQQL